MVASSTTTKHQAIRQKRGLKLITPKLWVIVTMALLLAMTLTLPILFQDGHLIAVNKPRGLLVHEHCVAIKRCKRMDTNKSFL